MVPALSWLFYGVDASGKSYMLGSAIVDQVTKDVLRPNSIILDYEEKMGHLSIPEDVTHDMRPSPKSPAPVLTGLRDWIDGYRREIVGEKKPYEVIGLDSISRYQAFYRVALGEQVAKDNPKEDKDVLSERSWQKMGSRTSFDIQYLTALKAMGSHIICTTGADLYEDDLDPFGDGKIQPLVAGMLRRRLGYFFDMIVYVEKIQPSKKNGLDELVHRYHFAKNGDFKVRNGMEHWNALPNFVDATAKSPVQFDTILSYLKEADVGGN